jgi:hypothetical protein
MILRRKRNRTTRIRRLERDALAGFLTATVIARLVWRLLRAA